MNSSSRGCSASCSINSPTSSAVDGSIHCTSSMRKTTGRSCPRRSTQSQRVSSVFLRCASRLIGGGCRSSGSGTSWRAANRGSASSTASPASSSAASRRASVSSGRILVSHAEQPPVQIDHGVEGGVLAPGRALRLEPGVGSAGELLAERARQARLADSRFAADQRLRARDRRRPAPTPRAASEAPSRGR